MPRGSALEASLRDERDESQSIDDAPATAALKRATAPPALRCARVAGSRAPVEGTPLWRDAVFRRLLALADLAAGAGGLAVLSSVTPHHIPLAGYAAVPLIVLIAKVTGRYDHDELVLRKSTLDEIPRLLSVAGAFALAWSVVAFLAGVRLSSAERESLSCGARQRPSWSPGARWRVCSASCRRHPSAGSDRRQRSRAHPARALARPPTRARASTSSGSFHSRTSAEVGSDWGPRSRRRRQLRRSPTSRRRA